MKLFANSTVKNIFLFCFLLAFFYASHCFGQNGDVPSYWKKNGVKVLIKKEYYLNDGKLEGDTACSATYFNRKGLADSSRSFNNKGNVLDVWKNLYDDDILTSSIHYSSYYKRQDTSFYKQNNSSVYKYDSLGNIIEQVYNNKSYPAIRTVFHYDRSNRFSGREYYNAKEQLVGSDKKIYSKTGKLTEWIEKDEKNRVKAHQKCYYDQYDSLVMEVDSGFGRTINFNYAMIQGKWRMTREYERWEKSSSSSTHKYIFHPDSSYEDVVTIKRFNNGIKLFARKKGTIIYYFDSIGNKILQEEFDKGKLIQKETYTSGRIIKRESFYRGKIQKLEKYEMDNPVYSLEITMKGDTSSINEWTYDINGLLLNEKHCNLDYLPESETEKKAIAIRRRENISVYNYLFY